MLIDTAVNANTWKILLVYRGGPIILHMLFVDNLLLFVRTNPTQAKVVRHIMEVFCKASGQRISADKSIAYTSPKVPNEIRHEIQHITGIRFTEDLGKYLDVLLLQSH